MSARSRAAPWFAQWRWDDLAAQAERDRWCVRCGGCGLDPEHDGACGECLGFGGRVEHLWKIALDGVEIQYSHIHAHAGGWNVGYRDLEPISGEVEVTSDFPTYRTKITGLDE